MLPGLHLDIVSALVHARGRLSCGVGGVSNSHLILTVTCETSTAYLIPYFSDLLLVFPPPCSSHTNLLAIALT